MGMDVYGKKPTSEAGRYFRNNVWWWRPLAEYIFIHGPPELVRKCQHWHTNDGDGLKAEDSVKLAEFLQGEIESGRTQTWAAERAAKLGRLPRETCDICQGSGIRSDEIGREKGHLDKLISAANGFEPTHPRFGRMGWCNGCDGQGTRERFETWYDFSVENVQEFVTFLRHCGGFEIC